MDAHGLPHPLLAQTPDRATTTPQPTTAPLDATPTSISDAAAGAAAVSVAELFSGGGNINGGGDMSASCQTATNAGVERDVAHGGCSNSRDVRGRPSANGISEHGGGDSSGGSIHRCQCSVFTALARSMVYQQLATAAAATIWSRVLVACKVCWQGEVHTRNREAPHRLVG